MIKALEVREEDVDSEYAKQGGTISMEVTTEVEEDGQVFEETETKTFGVAYHPGLNRYMALVPEDMVKTFTQVFGW